MTYPAFDFSWKFWGRVQDLIPVEKGFELVFESGPRFNVEPQSLKAEIKKNDWVALDRNDHWILVAPSLVTPQSLPNLQTQKNWMQFLNCVRQFFQNRSFLELQTPTLVVCPGTEPSLDVFPVELKLGSSSYKRFLPTSPELHLKKALAMGLGPIFEIAKCYRNGEVTRLHQPEFFLLEWYRSFSNLNPIQIDCVELVNFLALAFKKEKPRRIECWTVRQLFQKYLDFDLKPTSSYADYCALARRQGIHLREQDSLDDLFFLLMMEKIESQFDPESLIFVEKYPPFQAALARKSHDGWALRFEMYWKGMEIANAFDELNDPAEQRRRSEQDLAKKRDQNPVLLDEEFFKSLESGMPPSAGIALGLERLFMALFEIKDIRELRLFPISF